MIIEGIIKKFLDEEDLILFSVTYSKLSGIGIKWGSGGALKYKSIHMCEQRSSKCFLNKENTPVMGIMLCDSMLCTKLDHLIGLTEQDLICGVKE